MKQRFGPAFGGSLAFHAAIGLLALLVSRGGVDTSSAVEVHSAPARTEVVWLHEAGPGGGGGGGGNRMKAPPRQAKLPGADRITVPVAKPVTLTPPTENTPEPNPVERLTIQASRLASSSESLIGAIASYPGASPLSQGPGDGDGAGTGKGTGDGPGRGSGFRDGDGGNTGGKFYQPGNGVTPPIDIYRGKPQYTAEAMRARIQGSVWVECVVQPNGACTDLRVVRSLDAIYGLDLEAIQAAGQWRFRPGTRRGEPVPVLVTIELAFTLH